MRFLSLILGVFLLASPCLGVGSPKAIKHENPKRNSLIQEALQELEKGSNNLFARKILKVLILLNLQRT